jgi:myo-inositol-1(or 4)-monophosphatase
VLPEVISAVQRAGALLADTFDPASRAGDLDEIRDIVAANDAASLAVMREPLVRARPGAGWADDEMARGALPAGEWWVADPVEGNINYLHGMTDWAVSATLIRDNEPVLTVVHMPLTGDTYTAVRGAGAFHNGEALRVSVKTSLSGALVATGQARPDEEPGTLDLVGASVRAMLGTALLVRMAVPVTPLLVQVAAGRMDAFWQYSDVRSGLVAGALLVAEAGGSVTEISGEPWTLSSPTLLVTTEALRSAAIDALSGI